MIRPGRTEAVEIDHQGNVLGPAIAGGRVDVVVSKGAVVGQSAGVDPRHVVGRDRPRCHRHERPGRHEPKSEEPAPPVERPSSSHPSLPHAPLPGFLSVAADK